jgi:hypothetical protein
MFKAYGVENGLAGMFSPTVSATTFARSAPAFRRAC